MTMSNTQGVAVLRRKYPKGKLPKSQFVSFPTYSVIDKDETFNGDDFSVPFQTENTAGYGNTIPNAQTNEFGGNYVRFLLTRVEYFSIARIKGQALRSATQRGEGAVVDLWDNETTSAEQAMLKQLEIYLYGSGNAVLGTVSSGIGTATITLTVPTDVNNFQLNQRVQLVSDTTLSPTVRVIAQATNQLITALDRSAGTITIGGNWSTVFTSGVNGDSIVNNGDFASSATANVPTGWASFLIGGSSPGTLFSLPRNPDPVRMAGQVYDSSGVNMLDAIIEAESLVTNQGQLVKKTLFVNPRDLAQAKKTLNSKVTYPRESVGAIGSSTAGVSFKTMQIEGDFDTIDVLPSPFCPRNKAWLIDRTKASVKSTGSAPMLGDFDTLSQLRLSTDDAYELRFVAYLQNLLLPFSSIRITNWGV